MRVVRYRQQLAMLATFAVPTAAWASGGDQLDEVLVTARQTPEDVQGVPLAISTLSPQRIADYEVSSLEKLGGLIPDLILTRGNSGSGLDISLRGIGPNFSSIGIEQSVAVVIDGVYYGQGRIIDESLADLDHIELLKGPQALFFGKNSTAGVISMTTGNPGSQLEARATAAYEFATHRPRGELVLSGPVSEDLGLRLVVSGRDRWGGYVHNEAAPGTYTTIDAATLAQTNHTVPAPATRDLPAESSVFARLTASYHPGTRLRITLKASADHNEQGGTSWNDRLWKCPSGQTSFPGASGEPCGEGFRIAQNPVPADIAATRPDLSREGGQLYTLYDSRALTADVEMAVGLLTLSSIANYQHFQYASNSDYDFTAVPAIWADQHNSYQAVSEELRAQMSPVAGLRLLGGVYFQNTAMRFTQSAIFYGSENSRADPADRYVSLRKDSATNGETWSGYGQVIWNVLPAWELAAGARYIRESKNSWFTQPYVNPFLTQLYTVNHRLSAEQLFRNISPEVSLKLNPTAAIAIYAAYRSGYKSGGFSNSGDEVIGSAGAADLSFQPEIARGVEVGLKATLADRRVRINADFYHYRFTDLQVDFFNAQNFALISTNAGAAVSEGVEVETIYLPLDLPGVSLRASLHYNEAQYRRFIGPCYGGQTQAQGCNIIGPPPDRATLQDLSGKPTADAPRWTGSLGVDYVQPLGTGLALGISFDARGSSRYSVSPFAQPLDMQPSYASLDAAAHIGASRDRWQLALIARNLTNRFVVTYATDLPSTGTPAGGKTGLLADQYALFAPGRTVQLQLTYRR